MPKTLTKNQEKLVHWLLFLRMTIGATIISVSSAGAGEPLPAIVSTLSEEKALVEGRAKIAKNCLSRDGQKPALNSLELKFSNVRNRHKAWIEGQIAVLQASPRKSPEEMRELFNLEELNGARNDAYAFVTSVEQELGKNKCAVSHKIGLKEIVLGAIITKAVDQLLEWLSSAGNDRHQNLIDILEKHKIVAWENVLSIVVYDWTQRLFYDAAGAQSPEILKKGGTVVYFNKWALSKAPPTTVLLDKELPPGLSRSYQAYGGPVKDLYQYISQNGEADGG